MKWEYKVSEPYNLTNEEAINAIEKNMPLAGTYTVLTEALHMAIKALRKQEPVKPVPLKYEPLILRGWEYGCPACEKAVGFNKYAVACTDNDPFCPTCGQAIDWREE